jgi:catechol-2,3-dioxygenase
MHEPAIAELGHVGIRCFDVEAQVSFYTEVLGLKVTDYAEQLKSYFLSARPKVEHHELLLAAGRDVPHDARLIQQVSFRCAELEDVLGFYRRFQQQGVTLDMVVSHGNAVGVYFYDPEGNRCEVYWQTGLEARQPFVQKIDLEQDPETLMEFIRASVEKYGDTGITDDDYVRWVKKQGASATTGAEVTQ